MAIKAVIFDLDGVIADSETLSSKAGDVVLKRYGIKKTEKERKEAFGRRVDEIFKDISDARNLNLDISKLIIEKDKVFEKLIRGKLKLIPNSIELVDFLKESGIKLALATSSHKEKMILELEELGISEHFDVLISGDLVEKSKPNPEIFLMAAKMLGKNPDECAVIEDSGFGVDAANNAGMLSGIGTKLMRHNSRKEYVMEKSN